MTLQLCARSCAHTDDDLPPIEPTEFPDDDGDWEAFDPTPLESWILDDFDWEIEESYPERGDYWDDSLDGEWDLAAAGLMHSQRVCLPVTRGKAAPTVRSQAEPENQNENPEPRTTLLSHAFHVPG
jgi:hypothetical protein